MRFPGPPVRQPRLSHFGLSARREPVGTEEWERGAAVGQPDSGAVRRWDGMGRDLQEHTEIGSWETDKGFNRRLRLMNADLKDMRTGVWFR